MKPPMKLGYSHPETLQYFDDLFKNREREKINSVDVPLGGTMVPTDVFEVPLDLPRYRLSNTRTIALQEQYIAFHDLPEDYFESDPLSDKLQADQHEILKNLILRKNLKSYFETNQQTHPLVLTHEGFVISGNRRLCAFRELYYSEGGSTEYKRFERVKVAILPRLSEEEIEYIEDYYEQQPDIQDEFTWVSRALGFKKRLERHNYDSAELATKSNVKKAMVDSLLNKLSVAEEYLEYIDKQKQYDIIENDEYAFNNLLKARKKFDDDPGKKEVFQKLSFLALKNQEQITDRMYNNIPILQEIMGQVVEDIKGDYSNQIEKQKVKDAVTNPLGDPDEESEPAHAILNIIENKENEENLFGIIVDRVNEYKLLKQNKKSKEAVLKKLQRAHKELAEANNIIDDKTIKDGVLQQLENIDKEIIKLKLWVNGNN